MSPLHRGIRNVRVGGNARGGRARRHGTHGRRGRRRHRRARRRRPDRHDQPARPPGRHGASPSGAAPGPGSIQDGDSDHTTSLRLVAAAGPSDVFDRAEVCAASGITQTQLQDLGTYGLVYRCRGTGSSTTFTESDLSIVKAAAGFLGRGTSTPGTCGRGGRAPSARPACSSSGSCRCCASVTTGTPGRRGPARRTRGPRRRTPRGLVVAMLRHHLDG
ncbi:MAG: hypothetical protein R2713_16540 [Ilumatobacteraceae bacterium]